MPNPNPSPSTRFQPGVSGNPGGKTKEHVEAEREAARASALLRAKMLSSMQEKVEGGADPLELMTSEALKLFKDSEDRAHGQPDQNVNANISPREAAEAKIDAILSGYAERSGVAGDTSEG